MSFPASRVDIAIVLRERLENEMVKERRERERERGRGERERERRE